MELTTTAAALGIVLGLTEVLKRIIGDSRFAPLISLFLGVGIALLAVPGVNLKEVVLQGLIYGLSASGLYAGGKTVIGK